MTDLTEYLNVLNMKLQAKDQIVSELIGHVNGFQNKLKGLQSCLAKNDQAHFPCCQVLSDEIEEGDFTEFCEKVEVESEEFGSRLVEFDDRKNKLHFYKVSTSALIFKLILLFTSEQKKERTFSRFLLVTGSDSYEILVCRLQLFGSMHVCCIFKHEIIFVNENKYRNWLSDILCCIYSDFLQ